MSPFVKIALVKVFSIDALTFLMFFGEINGSISQIIDSQHKSYRCLKKIANSHWK